MFSDLVPYPSKGGSLLLIGSNRCRRIRESHVDFLCSTEKNRAGLIRLAAERDDVIEFLVIKLIQPLGSLPGNINP